MATSQTRPFSMVRERSPRPRLGGLEHLGETVAVFPQLAKSILDGIELRAKVLHRDLLVVIVRCCSFQSFCAEARSDIRPTTESGT
jgi:hypothetical protein